MKSLFHHIRVHHITEFLKNTETKWIEEAETGRPLKVYWETNVDEELGHSDLQILYVCLATDKCFTTEERGMRHFKHNPAALKKHNTQLRLLKKEKRAKKLQEEKAKEKRPAAYFFQKALRENDPKLIEGLWRGISHWKAGCDLALSLSYKLKDDSEFTFQKTKTTWKETVDIYRKRCLKAQSFLTHGTANASDLNALYNYFWSFITYWKDNIVSVGEIDPRLDPKYPESIIVERDESVIDEEFFYVATAKMSIPTLETLAPPATVAPPPEPESESEPEIEVPVVLPGLTKKQTTQFVKQIPPTSREWSQAWTSLHTGKVMMPPEAQMIQQMYPNIIHNSKVKRPVKAA